MVKSFRLFLYVCVVLTSSASFARPPLLDLAATLDSRVPYLNGDAIEAFADARDSIADFQALGWTITNVTAQNCLNNSADDLTAIQTAVNSARPNTVIYLSSIGSPCYYNGTIPIVVNDKSNIIIMGRGRNATFVMSNIPVINNAGDNAFRFGASAAFSLFEATTFNWNGGIAGSTSIVVTDAAGGDSVDIGERIWMEAADPDGRMIAWTSVVVSANGNPSRTLVIQDPLPTEFTATTATLKIYKQQDTNSGWVDHVGVMDMTIDQMGSARVPSAADPCPQSPGTNGPQAPNYPCPWSGIPPIEFRNVRHARVERVTLPHSFSKFLALAGGATNGNADHAIVRGTIFDEMYLAYNRGNNNGVVSFGAPHSVGHYFANNVVGDRSPRFLTFESAAGAGITGIAAGWNYQAPMEAISGTNTACATGGGRFMFIGHGDQPVSANIMESNDSECHWEIEGNTATNFARRNVLYRNRVVRTSSGSFLSGLIAGSNASHCDWMTLFLNRFSNLDGGSNGSFCSNGATLNMSYNVAENVCELGANGPQNACSGTNLNPGATYVGNDRTRNALSITQSANYPVSMILSRAPSWWCQEACAWSDTAGPGAAEANTGAPLCKLPAQILSEGGTCTPLNLPRPLSPSSRPQVVR